MIAAKNLQIILSKGDNYEKNVPSRSAIYHLDTLPCKSNQARLAWNRGHISWFSRRTLVSGGCSFLYDRSKHKERTATFFQMSDQKKKFHLSFLGGFWSVKVPEERGEHSNELLLLNTSIFFKPRINIFARLYFVGLLSVCRWAQHLRMHIFTL